MATTITEAATGTGTGTGQSNPPVKKWVSDLAKKWNSKAYSLFILHGNIYDVFPVKKIEGFFTQINYVSLKSFISERLFPDIDRCMMFFDISDGLTFRSREIQGSFNKWLEVYDTTEKTTYSKTGLPKDFVKLSPVLKRFFMKMSEENRGVTLIIDFAEKIVPASDASGSSLEERQATVALLKWGISPEIRSADIGIFLVTESISELQSDLIRNPYFAQISIDLPDKEDRLYFLQSGLLLKKEYKLSDFSDISIEDLADRTSGLNIVRMQHYLGEVINNGIRITPENIANTKKRLIEEFCQGLVKFVEPNKNITLNNVATHMPAKKKFRELAWLIKNNKRDVLERGVLLPGRVGVGKSFIVYCFASECGLPVLEIGDFRSKWVGDTEKQQTRILMIIKALGPVIIVVDEADAVFGNRNSGGDSGVSTRVFAAFAAHIGDSSLRGKEVWIAMTSRPDLMAIDMKRQGRFGLCIPLFPANSSDELKEMFAVVAKTNKLIVSEETMNTVVSQLGGQRLTGSEVEAIVIRSKEHAVLDNRSEVTTEDFKVSIESFIDPLDPNLLSLQELAAVLACSDKRFLPERYLNGNREDLYNTFIGLKAMLDRS